MIDKRKFNKTSLRYKTKLFLGAGVDSDLTNYLITYFFQLELGNPLLIAGVYSYLFSIIKKADSVSNKARVFNNNLCNLMNECDDDFLKIKKSYDTYVKKIAEYIRELNIEDPVDIGMLFTTMLASGMFSSDGHYSYKKLFRDNDYYYPQIMGARIASGFGVCRNSAALLSDVYNKLGIDANYISINTNKFTKHANHAAVIISSEDGSFIIDPTSCMIGILDDSLSKCSDQVTFVGMNAFPNFKVVTYMEDGEEHFIDDKFYKKYNNIRKMDSIEIHNRFLDVFSYWKGIVHANDYQTNKFTSADIFRENNSELISDIDSMHRDLTVKSKKLRFKKH